MFALTIVFLGKSNISLSLLPVFRRLALSSTARAGNWLRRYSTKIRLVLLVLIWT
jgi:hypothetical protein